VTPTTTRTVTATRIVTSTATLTPTATATSGAVIVNLAVGKTVTDSTHQDSSHLGSMAVDGSLSTYWQTRKISGRHPPTSEWIIIDLGGTANINKVVLEWLSYYATSYSIDISSNYSNWTTIFSTTSGNGGNDTITTIPYSLRYIRFSSTAWNNSTLRNWLREFEVYGYFSSPIPTATPTLTPTASGN
jgi:F5/8 type C domain